MDKYVQYNEGGNRQDAFGVVSASSLIRHIPITPGCVFSSDHILMFLYGIWYMAILLLLSKGIPDSRLHLLKTNTDG